MYLGLHFHNLGFHLDLSFFFIELGTKFKVYMNWVVTTRPLIK